ncbi:MAG: endonuclease/exonuclease/phosphatase family protein [Methyloceanibacter sp.]|nr:endonuclease/exonuclease/phosphatase family protein [Methyloceanibacter sp.]
MLYALFRLTLWASVLAVTAVTLFGLLAGWFPLLELLNHFRPFWLAGALALVLAALPMRDRGLIAASAAVAILNIALFVFALAGGARSADANVATFLRVLAFNIQWSNNQIADIARELQTSGADVLVLAEVSGVNRDSLEKLRGDYPFHTESLGLAIFSKHPILQTEDIGWTFRPPYSGFARWVRLDVKGKPVEVVGVHLSDPFLPKKQAEEMQTLTALAQERTSPLIVAGDFNLTPWSAKLQRFSREAGMRRTNTFMLTWPVRELPAFVAIDNIYVSPQFSVIDIKTGPSLGADHLPLIVDLALEE